MFHTDYRPQRLNEIVGNEEIIQDLQRKFPNWPTTILIAGPSGCGKTTLARVIANELGCKSMYLKEIDAAQDRGIDAMRNLIRDSYARPLVGEVKVYILDEAQMLTSESMNALLKITEEPPKKTYFIFCSTSPEKIIATLRNRCSKIALSPLNDREIALIIKRIADKEKIQFTDTLKEIGKFILKQAKGVPREAIILFESLKDCTSLEEAEIKIHGFTEEDPKIYALVNAIMARNYNQMMTSFMLIPQTNFESLRIATAKIIKKFIMKSDSIERKNELHEILEYFTDSVDNYIGDIKLIQIFWKLRK